MTVTRRPFVLDPGTPLFVSTYALDHITAFGDFLDATALPAEAVVRDPVVAIPLPVYSRGQRFRNVCTDALWNPLFWLPESIALRFKVLKDETSEPQPETDIEWALRIAAELSISGLYDTEHGWLDVFALYGLDVDNPVDLARVEAWQQGEADDVLDNIDLTEHVTFSEDFEAFYVAQELEERAMPAQWGYTASSLLDVLSEDEGKANANSYALLASEMLVSEPGDASDELWDAAQHLEAGDDAETWHTRVTEILTGVLNAYADDIAAFENQA